MNVTVYCGASQGNSPFYSQVAKKLGDWIAQNNHTLIYGGGKAGMMGKLANTVLKKGGQVIGIIPTFLKERELAHSDLTEIIEVNSMAERKQKMLDYGDACIALPGGPGTLEEITEVISWSRIGKNQNPCIVYNENNYYDALKNMYDTMVNHDFLTHSDRNTILFSNDLTQIETFIQNYKTPEIRSYS